MKQITTSIVVEAAPERVFAVFADFENAAANVGAIRSLELLGDGPIGVGKRFRETRVVFKKEATEEMEITAFDPPRGYQVSCESCGARFVSDFRFRPEGPGTRVDVDVGAQPLSFAAKLLSPLSGMMLKSCAKAVQGDLEDLRAVCEGTAAPRPTTA
jgi:carbon monoxide dehydrogenase subunit G